MFPKKQNVFLNEANLAPDVCSGRNVIVPLIHIQDISAQGEITQSDPQFISNSMVVLLGPLPLRQVVLPEVEEDNPVGSELPQHLPGALHALQVYDVAVTGGEIVSQDAIEGVYIKWEVGG